MTAEERPTEHVALDLPRQTDGLSVFELDAFDPTSPVLELLEQRGVGLGDGELPRARFCGRRRMTVAWLSVASIRRRTLATDARSISLVPFRDLGER